MQVMICTGQVRLRRLRGRTGGISTIYVSAVGRTDVFRSVCRARFALAGCVVVGSGGSRFPRA